MNKDQPIFISFYTNNGKYPKKAKVLEKSLKDFNLRYELVPLNKNFNSFHEENEPLECEYCGYPLGWVQDSC